MNNEVMIFVDILCETQHYNTVLNAISLEQHKSLPHYLQLQASLEDRVLSVDIQTARVF